MADGAGVGEVVNAGQFFFCHEDRDREKVVEQGHGIWNVDNLFIPAQRLRYLVRTN